MKRALVLTVVFLSAAMSMRASSADGSPFIGRPDPSNNLFVATGFAGNGTTFGTLSAMLAVRANERSAAAAGISVVRVKIVGFAIGSFIAGIGGCLLAYLALAKGRFFSRSELIAALWSDQGEPATAGS